MNWKTFAAMMARDYHVARRNVVPLALQTMLQPLLFVFIFGQIMVRSGTLPAAYKSTLLPGIMAITMFMTGIVSVAMPLIDEFQLTREIEDRLLAPMKIQWLAIQKVITGMALTLISGVVVVLAARLLLGNNVGISFENIGLVGVVALLVALLSSAAGLTVGCSFEQRQIGLLFSLILAPIGFFGCVYYSWSALSGFPILQRIVLLNPLVYASEGLRGAFVPRDPHIPMIAVIAALAFFDTILVVLGLKCFSRKAIG